MTSTYVFASDPTIIFPENEVARLAKGHKIDQALLEAIIAEAAFFYATTLWINDEGYNGPDTLDEIEEPAAALSDLLANKVNRHRLFTELIGVEGGYATKGNLVTIADKFEQLLPFLNAIRLAAREAHRPRPQHRPKAKGDLAEAYRVLSRHWRFIFGDLAFTNKWDDTDKKLPPIPTSPAACFLYDVMKLIDLKRKRLAEELRDLMGETVRSLPGPRRGRGRRNLG